MAEPTVWLGAASVIRTGLHGPGSGAIDRTFVELRGLIDPGSGVVVIQPKLISRAEAQQKLG